MAGPLNEELQSNHEVILDLTGLSFIDSSGIAVLMRANRAAEDGAPGRLHTVIAEGSQVERIFRLAGIDRVLDLYPDRDTARAAIRPPTHNGNRAG